MRICFFQGQMCVLREFQRYPRGIVIFFALAEVFLSTILPAEASEKISLPLIPNVSRADIYFEAYKPAAKATLVLCPGMNGNGQDLIDRQEWTKFAKSEHLNLVGLSFASDADPEGRGYFSISSGSGKLLEDGLMKALGAAQPPLLIYGFSRGAQFTYSFAKWKPERVLAWCAYSATEWEVPTTGSTEPKGIIACGDEDESNYSFSALQFLKGRSMGKPWTWVSLKHTGHVPSASLDDFVRCYFGSLLEGANPQGLWLDVDTKSGVSIAELKEHPTLAAWLPDENVAQAWKEVHQP